MQPFTVTVEPRERTMYWALKHCELNHTVFNLAKR
jgi:hypothetical protein